jgi:DUF1009 family protein
VTTQTRSSAPVGLLAGGGRFPIVFAQKARAVGLPVVCVGVKCAAAPELAGLVGKFYWAGLARLGRMIRCFKRAGVTRVVMAGKIGKSVMHSRWRFVHNIPDWRFLRLWFSRRRRDNKDDSLLLAVIDEFASDGIHFESALDLCPELLVKPGVLTRREPTQRERADIAFGWELAKEMGRLEPSSAPANCAPWAASRSSRSPSRSRTCASTCRRSAAPPSRRSARPAGASWPSRPEKPSSSTRPIRSRWPTATG